jgi:hypothetical protein
MFLEHLTLPLGDLLLLKLQIPKLTVTDIQDICALLITASATDKAMYSMLERVIEVTTRSWRWWRAVSISGEILLGPTLVKNCNISESEAAVIRDEIDMICKRVGFAKKTWRWHLRSLFGDVLPWQETVETLA